MGRANRTFSSFCPHLFRLLSLNYVRLLKRRAFPFFPFFPWRGVDIRASCAGRFMIPPPFFPSLGAKSWLGEKTFRFSPLFFCAYHKQFNTHTLRLFPLSVMDATMEWKSRPLLPLFSTKLSPRFKEQFPYLFFWYSHPTQ